MDDVTNRQTTDATPQALQPVAMTPGLMQGRRSRGRPPGVGNRVSFSCWLTGDALKIRRLYSMYRNEEVLAAAFLALEVVRASTRALCFHEAFEMLRGKSAPADHELPVIQRMRDGVQHDEMVEQVQLSAAV